MEVLGEWNWYLPKWLEWIPQRRKPEVELPKPAPAPARP